MQKGTNEMGENAFLISRDYLRSRPAFITSRLEVQ